MNRLFAMSRALSLILLCAIVMSSCGGPQLPPVVSFYFWKTNYHLDAAEKNAILQNQTQQIYVRYFDIVYDENLKQAVPAAPVHFDKADVITPIVPVVFIKNRVFEMLDSAAVDTLVEHSVILLNQINRTVKVKAQELQIDCDWTKKTSAMYFHFLKSLRKKIDAHDEGITFKSLTMLSATIRLHQVKYPEREGVPPVDKGILMFYNMGKIDASDVNSIYDQKISQAYLPSLAKYPLRLDVALPVFAWGIHLRDGAVVELLNKMDSRDFKDTATFTFVRENRYRAKSSFFKNGFYFKEGDEVKVEEQTEKSLQTMAQDLKHSYPKRLQQIIFYDLDSLNISRYEHEVFKKTATYF